MQNYVVLKAVASYPLCALSKMQNVQNPRRLTKGMKLEPWPDDVKLDMDPNYPKAIQLADCIQNSFSAIVVSKRFKEMIEASGAVNVEYLPVTIMNHKGRVASADYFIVNPYELQDCIDLEQSEIKWSAIAPTKISSCKNLQIDEGKIAAGSKIFRLMQLPTRVLLDRELANKAKAASLTGMHFAEIETIDA
jgi:hypothetical protein